VARDIGGADPERMTPMRIANYVDELFANSKVTVHVIQELSILEERYPLLAAVNRAANGEYYAIDVCNFI
jgi:leucyl aminopeptidase